VEEPNVAIYLDFENLAISALEVYRGIEQPLQIEPIIQYIRQKGRVRIKKVYADWSKKKFSLYQKDLLRHGFELIHLPETNLLGKNGSDMRLVIDVMEELQQEPRPDVVVIGSGDSDFIPLIQHMLNRNIEVVLLSFEHSVSSLIKEYSTEFGSLKKIIGDQRRRRVPVEKGGERPAVRPARPTFRNGAPPPKQPDTSDPEYQKGRKVLLRFLQQHKGEEAVSLSTLKRDLLELEPGFSEEKLGFLKFKKFVKAYKGDLVEKVEKKEKRWMISFFPQPTSDKQASPARRPSGGSKQAEKPSANQVQPARPQAKAQAEKAEAPSLEKVLDMIRAIGESPKTDGPMPLAKLKLLLLRKDADFSERKLGFRSFKQFVEAQVGTAIDSLSKEGHTVYVHFQPQRDLIGEAATYLKEELNYAPDIRLRGQMAEALMAAFAKYPIMTLKQMHAQLEKALSVPTPAGTFRTYLSLLKKAGVFTADQNGQTQLSARLLRLDSNVKHPDQLDEAYLEQVGMKVSAHFPDLATEALLDLLFPTFTEKNTETHLS
jgi:uncharacterized LabA/DUF88 family protein